MGQIGGKYSILGHSQTYAIRTVSNDNAADGEGNGGPPTRPVASALPRLPSHLELLFDEPYVGALGCSMRHELEASDAAVPIDDILKGAPRLRALAASSSSVGTTRSASPRSSTQSDQASRGAAAGKELLRSMVADDAEFPNVEQWLDSDVDDAFESNELPWTVGDGRVDAVPRLTSGRGSRRTDKATLAEWQKQFAARGSAAGKALLHSMLDSNGSEGEGSGLGLNTSACAYRAVVGSQPASSDVAPMPAQKPTSSRRRPALLFQDLLFVPMEKTSLLLLGSRGSVAAQRWRLRVRGPPAVTPLSSITGERGHSYVWIDVCRGRQSSSTMAEESQLQKWEPPDLDVRGHEDADADIRDSISDELEAVGHPQAAALGLQQKRRRSPVARGGFGGGRSRRAPALPHHVTSQGASCISQQQPTPNTIGTISSVPMAGTVAPILIHNAASAAAALHESPLPSSLSSSSLPEQQHEGEPVEMEVQEEEPRIYVHTYLAQALDAVNAEGSHEPTTDGGKMQELTQGHEQDRKHQQQQHENAARTPCMGMEAPATGSYAEEVAVTDLDDVLVSSGEDESEDECSALQDQQVASVDSGTASKGDVQTYHSIGNRSCLSDSESDRGAESNSDVAATAAAVNRQRRRVPLRRMDIHRNQIFDNRASMASKKKTHEKAVSKEQRQKQEKAHPNDDAKAVMSIPTHTGPSDKLQLPLQDTSGRTVKSDPDADSDASSDFDSDSTYSSKTSTNIGTCSVDKSGQARHAVEPSRSAAAETLTRPTVLGIGA